MVDPAWVALSLCKHLGGKTFRALLRDFDHDLHAILDADEPRLRRVGGIGPKIARAIRTIDLDKTVQAINRWQAAGVQIIPRTQPEYPPMLRPVEDAPPTLFALGQCLPWAPTTAYAVIGTRTPSPQARQMAGRIGAMLAECGHLVVSGLAAGVDTAAHLGALSVPGAQTAAVLGSGVLHVYPPENDKLAQAIEERGVLLCEVAPDAVVSSPGLVARNRIITGLCDAVIIVETAADGGAMHAARFAQAQGRPVYVVDNRASGNRALLANGALPLPDDLSNL